MANCNFYAVKDDFFPIFKHIFSLDQVRVFESYSSIGKGLEEFCSAEDLITVISHNKRRSLFVILPKTCEDQIEINRLTLNSGGIRYKIQGWGLISLQCGGIWEDIVRGSNINHNSFIRAKKWSLVTQYSAPPERWDWKETTRISSSINRFIRKQAVDKINGFSILPHAKKLITEGYSFKQL